VTRGDGIIDLTATDVPSGHRATEPYQCLISQFLPTQSNVSAPVTPTRVYANAGDTLMRACPESRRAIVGAVVGFAYGSVLAFLSFLAMGAGHGSWVPFLLSSAPFGVLVFFGDFGFYAALIGGAPVVLT
jgi:hypothetical protein